MTTYTNINDGVKYKPDGHTVNTDLVTGNKDGVTDKKNVELEDRRPPLQGCLPKIDVFKCLFKMEGVPRYPYIVKRIM